jgi:hypothetical protein
MNNLHIDVVYNAKEIVKALNELEPGLKNKMIKEIRLVAAPSITAIKSAIPKVSPFESKVRTPNINGRLAWGKGKKPDDVRISFKTKASKKFAVTSLVTLVVGSPATALADVAGKGSGEVRRAVTKEYYWQGQTRTHKVTTQGQKMIRHLRNRRKNNFVYPAVEKSLPMVKAEIKSIIERYAAKVNRKLN